MKKLFLFCLFMCVLNYVSADTIHNTNITSNETWSSAGNPHIIPTNISVSSGVTLTIAAGCEVKFDAGKKLTINGTINASGTSGNTISFDYNGTGGIWENIRLNNGSTGILSYCTIQHSASGINGYYAASISVDNCEISENRLL